MKIGLSLDTLQNTLVWIKKTYKPGDDIFLAKNKVGNLTVFVNDIAVGYIYFASGDFEIWPNKDWQYPISQHDYP